MASTDIYNHIQVNESLSTGGQPTAEQVTALAAEDFTTVVNLATFDPDRSLPDEAGLVRSLGMTYHAIPVDWNNPTETDFAAFERVMLQLSEDRALLHCAANFRVTAFFSLFALKHLGWSDAQAEAFRAIIWKGSDYPVWRAFISRMQAQIVAR